MTPQSTPPTLLRSATRPSAARPGPDALAGIARLIWLISLLATSLLPLLPLPPNLPAEVMTATIILRQIALAGLIVAAGELLVGGLRLLLLRAAQQRSHQVVLRVRLPEPQDTARSAALSSGAELFRAAHQLLPARGGRGPRPWLAMTIGAAPGEPASFGVVIGGPAGQVEHLAASLRQIIQGMHPEAFIDTIENSLALRHDIEHHFPSYCLYLLWREYGLHLSPAHPLRCANDADLLAPLVAALRPTDQEIGYTQLQLILQPRHDWGSALGGWRAPLRRRLARLLAHDEFGLGAESQALQQKLTSPAYDAALRVVVASNSTQAAAALLDQIGRTLGQYTAPGGNDAQRLVEIGRGNIGGSALDTMLLSLTVRLWHASVFNMRLRWLGQLLGRRGSQQKWLIRRVLSAAPRPRPLPNMALPAPLWRPPAILSADELAGLWHIPSAALGRLAAWLPCRALPAPAAAFLPETQPPPGDGARRIALGYASRANGSVGLVGPSLNDLRTILHLTAGMGTGKSRLLSNICAQLSDEGYALIDGKGDDSGNLARTVLDLIELCDLPRVVLLDITDAEWPIGMNPLAGVDPATPGAIDRALGQLQSIFARIDPEGWASAPGMQQFLELGARLVVETVPAPTIAHVRQALTDERYRAELLPRCRSIEVRSFWEQVYPATGEQQRSSLHALLRRFDKLLASDVVRGLITQAQPTFSFAEAFAQRLIVLAPIPHMAYGPLAATAAMLIFQSFLRAAFARPGSAATRRNYPLIVDEFQVLVEHGATQDVAAALSQLRSLGVPAIYAHQTLGQIGELADLMLINAENRVLLRTQEPDASAYARQYAASGLTAIDISGQNPADHQYARFVCAGQPVGPCSITPLPWRSINDDRMVAFHDGPDWQTVLPDGPADPALAAQLQAYDQEVCAMIYAPFESQRCDALAALPPDEWLLLHDRWQAIAAVQRRYIIANPGCIELHADRVRWLSRLGYARPRLLAEAEYRRIRAAARPGAAQVHP